MSARSRGAPTCGAQADRRVLDRKLARGRAAAIGWPISHCRLRRPNLMSTLLIVGIGVLVWLLVCLVVVALCVAARRGDDALAIPTTETSSSATTTRQARRHVRQRTRAERDRTRPSR